MSQVNSALAAVFPGQGSQSVGMLAVFAGRPSFDEVFARASEALSFDLWKLIQEGPAEALNLTANAQPALLTASMALWATYRAEGGVLPGFVAGHSLGEWSALVAAEVLALEDAVRLVRLRGEAMQRAVPVGQGGMAAVLGLDDARLEAICSECSTDETLVVPVNYNSPGQIVIAGHSAALERAADACKAAGAKRVLPLPVSAPFHTPLMMPARDALAEAVLATRFNAPVIPVVHNVHARTESDPAAIRELMLEQITAPVRWVGCVNTLVEAGVNRAVECGPGRVLAGLIKRITPAIEAHPMDTPEVLAAAVEAQA